MTEKTDWHPMWAELGLDLQKHDALLAVLGQAYEGIFLSQRDRPKGMGYFDFVMSEVHGLRVKELLDAKAQGRIVVGSFCVFVPEELVLAVDGVSVGLCAGAEFGTEAAEALLPRSTCALIKSAFGFGLEKVCPYIAASDVVVGENTCDGKKKSYELLDQAIENDVYVMDLPQTKSEAGRALLAAELERLARELERRSGRTITAETLSKGIDLVDAKRRAMARLAAARRADPAPISGLDALLANQVFFYDDPVRFTASVNALADELEERAGRGVGVAPKGAPRIVVSGCPMAVPNWKLHAIVEGAGAVIVGEESCVGERGTRRLVEPKGRDLAAMMEALVDRYFQIDCAVFTPNPGRTEHVASMSRGLEADGVIHYALQFCQPYQTEATLVGQSLKEGGVPVLRIETDYGQSDAEQIRTRVEAFLEQIRARG